MKKGEKKKAEYIGRYIPVNFIKWEAYIKLEDFQRLNNEYSKLLDLVRDLQTKLNEYFVSR